VLAVSRGTGITIKRYVEIAVREKLATQEVGLTPD
jgi:hypothetical protein